MEKLSKYSAFDLYKLSAKIQEMLNDENLIRETLSALPLGAKISCWNVQKNRFLKAIILEKNLKTVLVKEEESQINYKLPYYLIDLNSVEATAKLPTKIDFKTFDFVSFGKKKGMVTHLDDRNASVITLENEKYKVPYHALLKIEDAKLKQAFMKKLAAIFNRVERRRSN